MKKYVTFDKSTYPNGIIYCNCRDWNETDEDIARAIDSYEYVERFNKDKYVCVDGERIVNDNKIHVISNGNISYLIHVGSQVCDMENRTIPHTYYIKLIGMLV